MSLKQESDPKVNSVVGDNHERMMTDVPSSWTKPPDHRMDDNDPTADPSERTASPTNSHHSQAEEQEEEEDQEEEEAMIQFTTDHQNDSPDEPQPPVTTGSTLDSFNQTLDIVPPPPPPPPPPKTSSSEATTLEKDVNHAASSSPKEEDASEKATSSVPPSAAGTPPSAAGTTARTNRWSTWRQRANENAQALWRRTEEVQKMRWSPTGGSATTTTPPRPLRTASLDVPQNSNNNPETTTTILRSVSDQGPVSATNTTSALDAAALPKEEETPNDGRAPTAPSTGGGDPVQETVPSALENPSPPAAAAAAAASAEGIHHHHHRRRADTDDNASHDSSSHSSRGADSTTTGYSSSTGFFSSSVGTGTTDDGLRIQLALAASNLVDSVQSYRGRYSYSTPTNSTVGLQRPGSAPRSSSFLTPSPANSLVGPSPRPFHRGSSAGSNNAYLQELMEQLEPHQYIMLLGKGMLGVNLKQCFLKSQGVYIDFLVQHGAAHRSGMIGVGDALLQVGNLNVSRSNIRQAPQQIAQAKRPVHLVLATGAEPALDRVNAVDVAVGFLHLLREVEHQKQLQQQQEEEENAAAAAAAGEQLPSTPEQQAVSPQREGLYNPEPASKKRMEDSAAENGTESEEHHAEEEEKKESQEKDDSMELVRPTSFDAAEALLADNDDENSITKMLEVEITVDDSVQGFVRPVSPSLHARELFLSQVAKRCNDNFSVSMLCQAMATQPSFRSALRNALILCTVDARRFPYLAHYLTEYEELVEEGKQAELSSNAGVVSPVTTPNAMFLLLFEMVNFSDLYGVIPAARRREVARRIACKFFLPTRTGIDLTPPAFDFHHIVPVSSLRRLEAALDNTDPDNVVFGPDVFLDFQVAVLDKLSGHPFVSFLASNECARMRAYTRSTAPFVNVPLKDAFESFVKKPADSAAKNYFVYLVSYLLCRTDKDGHGESDDILCEPNTSRIEDAASGICAAVFLRSVLLPAIEDARTSPSDDNKKTVIAAFERFWEVFVAPGVGALECSANSNETSQRLHNVRKALDQVRLQAQLTECPDDRASDFAGLLTDTALTGELKQLADELLYDYAVNAHSYFRQHKFYEWLCEELCARDDEMKTGDLIPELPTGCVKRFLRKAEFPSGVSSHKPFIASQSKTSTSAPEQKAVSLDNLNAECAVVFGTSVGVDLAVQNPTPAMDQNDIRRYTCQPIGVDSNAENTGKITPAQIPATLESYAVVPPSRRKPFGNDVDGRWRSSDGWEAYLVDFMIPRADTSSDDGEQSSLYGVSLVFQKRLASSATFPVEQIQTELVKNESGSLSDINAVVSEDDPQQGVNGAIASSEHALCSPISFDTPKRSNSTIAVTTRKVRVSIESPIFNERLNQQPWTERISDEVNNDDAFVTVGLALVSHQNVVIAMRETLAALLEDFSRSPDDSADANAMYGPLVDILGNFSHQDVEPASLNCILEPFLRTAASPWLERPIQALKDRYEELAGYQLIRSLPPVPMALLFVTALLEQKIVFSSSRRGLLMAATTALQQLLRPLKWCHLIVPRAPAALAHDLLQYPAPFILGLPAEDPGVMDLIRDLPQDITLVDLDVGRVILAPSFAHNSEMGRGTPNNEDTARALRSQVLYLAQSLGNVFGTQLDGPTWSCDRPLRMSSGEAMAPQPPFETLRSICHEFVQELLAGTTSCCYWMEEASGSGTVSSTSEPTVLFDEDRFFHIKNLRHDNVFEPLISNTPTLANNLAMKVDDFDLILEIFLRSQSMNAYIGSRQREEMLFAL